VTRPRVKLPSPWLLVFPLAAFLLLFEVLAGGQVLLPAAYLRGMLPWSSAYPLAPGEALPQWNVLQWDGMAEFYPWRLQAARSFAAGLVPLWDPYVLCGTPFLANSQSAPLYPLHWLYYLPSAPSAAGPGADTAVRMGWLAFLHLSLAGSFAYLLCRDWGTGPVAACLGGLTYELSGFAVAWLELPSFISVGCWIPLLVLCVSRAVRERSNAWTTAAGAAGGMMLLAGHLQIAFYGLIAAGLAWLWETASLWSRAAVKDRRGLLGRAILAGVGTVGIAFALAAPQVLPAVELSRMSHRAGTPSESGFADYVKFALPLQNAITLLVPDFYGLPGRNSFWGYWNYSAPNTMEYAGHVGSAAFALVVVGIVWGWRVNPRAVWVAVVAAVALLLATGSPLTRLFYFYVPGFSQSGSPARALVLFCLAQALLAALGWEWLSRRLAEKWHKILPPIAAGAGVTVALVYGLRALSLANLPGEILPISPQSGAISASAVTLSLGLLGVAVLVVAIVAWLFHDNKAEQRTLWTGLVALVTINGGMVWFSRDYNLTATRAAVYPPTPLTTALQSAEGRVAVLNQAWSLLNVSPQAVLPPNAAIAYGWRDAQGYDSLYLGQYRRFANLLAAGANPSAAADASPEANGNMVFIKNADSPAFPLLAARWVVSGTPLTRAGLVPAPGFPAGPPYVYENRHTLPDAYTVTRWDAVADVRDLSGLAYAVQSAGPAAKAWISSEHRNAPGPDSSAPWTVARPAEIRRVSPQHIEVRANPTATSLLVLVESHAPGWKATIEAQGQPPRRAPVLRANGTFQGVVLAPGMQTIRFRYEPAGFRVGLYIGLSALALCCGVIAAAGLRKREPLHESA